MNRRTLLIWGFFVVLAIAGYMMGREIALRENAVDSRAPAEAAQ